MRFIDEAKIKIIAGHGGPGCVSFRRETFVPRGGPDGGDGGDGGDVIFVASSQLSTLQDFRYQRVCQAQGGAHGSGSNKAGKDGANLVIRVPVGTVVRDASTGEQLVDFIEDGQEWIAAQGGRGGKGNAHFVTSTFQAPKFAQDGEPGEEREVILELKLLADAAIIGFPNAGKSTLISRISAARPKIADYPFTTLTPNLGVVSMGGDHGESFVIADIPGLIEGAHRGAGLGHRFLKHIERTRAFVHLLDGAQVLEIATREDEDAFERADPRSSPIERADPRSSPIERADPRSSPIERAVEEMIDRYEAIRRELGLFSEKLLHKPEIVAINKIDVLESDPELVERVRKALRQRIASIRGTHPLPSEPFVVSAATGRGLQELLSEIYNEIRAHRSGASSREERVRLPDDEGIRN